MDKSFYVWLMRITIIFVNLLNSTNRCNMIYCWFYSLIHLNQFNIVTKPYNHIMFKRLGLNEILILIQSFIFKFPILKYIRNFLFAFFIFVIIYNASQQEHLVVAYKEKLDIFSNSSNQKNLPQTIILDPYLLLEIKNDFNNSKNYDEFVTKVIQNADFFLSVKPLSVIDKGEKPPSGNIHDFYSLSAYEWPNPNTSDGLPYVPRDGMINPEIYSISDKKNMEEMIKMVKILSLAYYFSDDPKYVTKAKEFLYTWFLDKNTLMNPNLNYAEIVRGKNEIRAQGIMEGRPLSELTDAIRLMQSSSYWTQDIAQGMNSWFRNYLDWLLNSDSGKEESRKMNNHGTYYLVQISSIGLFLNETEFVKKILKSTMSDLNSASLNELPSLISIKILSDGSQPFELKRVNSLDYSLINLLGLFTLANIAERVGLDLWNYELHGAGLEKALNFLIPYIQNQDDWPYSQGKKLKYNILAEVLCEGALNYKNNKSYIEKYRSYNASLIESIYFPICNRMTQ